MLRGEKPIGALYGAFVLDELHAESAAFETDDLANKEAHSRRIKLRLDRARHAGHFDLAYLLVVWAIARKPIHSRARAQRCKQKNYRDC